MIKSFFFGIDAEVFVKEEKGLILLHVQINIDKFLLKETPTCNVR